MDGVFVKFIAKYLSIVVYGLEAGSDFLDFWLKIKAVEV